VSKNNDALKPQLHFRHAPDNSGELFVPRIMSKPHSKVPLSPAIVMYNKNFPEFFNQYLTQTTANENQVLKDLEHPYQHEIESLVFEDSGWASTDQIDPVLPQSESKTAYTQVALPDQLALMISELRTQTEIAVDLEHHSYRSYQGFTC
jgi:exosome complex exonuclease RRP6